MRTILKLCFQWLLLAKDGDNELYKVIYRSDDQAKVKRSIKDPDENDVPAPLGFVMFGFGMGALLALRRRFKKRF